MPELPEVETVRRGLSEAVTGSRVRSVRVWRPDYVRVGAGRRSAERAPKKTSLLSHQTIERVVRRGKQIAIVGDQGSVVCVHLGMSGSLAAGESGSLQRALHTHLRWELEGGHAFQVTDPRRFGGIWAFESMVALEMVRWRELGEDALTVTPNQLLGRLGGTQRALKAALLDQRVVAGLGNIYADESLHRAGLHPQRPAQSLKQPEVDRLIRAVRKVLAEAIEAGGSSLRDHVMLNGDAGRFQLAHRVYGRGNQPCKRCGVDLVTDSVAQRTTVWCRVCQPLKGVS